MELTMINDVLQRNNVNISGKGKQTMMFAHGFGCDQNMWKEVAREFENDYQVVLFDFVGAGKSDIKAYDSLKYNSLLGYAQDVIEICEALQVEDVIFVGHSVGSMIGLLASIKEPKRFSRMVLVGPSPCYLDDEPYKGGFTREDLLGILEMMDKNYIGWAHFFAPIVMENNEQPHLTNRLEESFCTTDPIVARQFAEVTFFSDHRKSLAKVSVPSLILHCKEDKIAPLDVAHYMCDNLYKTKLQVIDGAGHCPHLSHPKETTAFIQQYLATAQEN